MTLSYLFYPVQRCFVLLVLNANKMLFNSGRCEDAGPQVHRVDPPKKRDFVAPS